MKRLRINLGKNCSGQILADSAGRTIASDITDRISANPAIGRTIVDLGCGNGWLLQLLIKNLTESQSGNDWRKRVSLHGIDCDKSAEREFKKHLGGNAKFHKSDITKDLPIEKESCIFTLMSQLDTVLNAQRLSAAITNARTITLTKGYIGFLMAHPNYSEHTVSEHEQKRLNPNESIRVKTKHKKKWYHGRNVITNFFKENDCLQIAEVDFYTFMPTLQYRLFTKKG